MKKLIAVAGLAAAMIGCTTVNKNDGGSACIAPGIVKDNVHIKYELGKNAISATETIQWINLGWISFSWGGTADHIADCAPKTGFSCPLFGPTVADRAKNGAYAKACSANNADSIVASRYTVTDTSYGIYGKATAEITGYAAKIAGVELMPAK